MWQLPFVRSCNAWRFALAVCSSAIAVPSNLHIRVDAFGYRPRATKIAIVRQPVVGYDAPAAYPTPTLLELRRASDQVVVLSGAAAAWNAGATHAASGDKVWWFDFSSVQVPGTYSVVDPATGARSEDFAIAADVFDPVLRAAMRMYFYQRCGAPKATPFAEAQWADAPCHLHAQQDLDCRLVTNPTAATSKDLSGGWHDAGDYNKYVNFADDALHELLAAYELDTSSWPDDFGIPESGNGVPDILDEIRYELTWLLKMQNADGSVLHKISVTDFSSASPPSADTAFRRYAPATASATISACGVFARAAFDFEGRLDPSSQAFGALLRVAAINAWNWLDVHPGQIPSNYDNQGFQNVAAEDSAYEQQMNRMRAAVHLFRLTGLTQYKTHVEANVAASHLFQWGWASPFEQDWQEALLTWSETPGATLTLAQTIRTTYSNAMKGGDHLAQFSAQSDAYRAFLYDQDHTWGSNRAKCREGTMYAAMNRLGLDVANAARYRIAAEDYAHYIHGVNPTGYCYLSNLFGLGAENSVPEMYSAWFKDGSIYDNAHTSQNGPAPGYLVGGVNPSFAPDPSYNGPTLAPPMNQPVLKSFKAWNADWPQNSWELTECHIPMQASYVRLLAEYSIGQPAVLSFDISLSLAANTNAAFQLGGCDPNAFVAVLYSTSLGSFTHFDPPWAVDLDLAVLPNPFAYLLFTGTAKTDGQLGWNVFVPPGLSGITLHFQATQAGTSPNPTQSAVITRLLP